MSEDRLPTELTALVNEVTRMWGDIIREEAGEKIFKSVESLRSHLKNFRKKSTPNKEALLLNKLYKKINAQSLPALADTTHAFAVLLELINICENSVHSLKIRKHELANTQKTFRPLSTEQHITLVLTAHPTESRAPEIVVTLFEIQKIVFQALTDMPLKKNALVKPLLRRLWHLRLARSKSPEVKDEADFIYSILFRKETMDVLLENPKRNISLRTWVGGDKDGHPGVNSQVMLQSLQLSRNYLYKYLLDLLQKIELELTLSLTLTRHASSASLKKHLHQLKSIKNKVYKLDVLQRGDGLRIVGFNKSWKSWVTSLPAPLLRRLESVQNLQNLLKLFPALVVPLEFRESSDVLREPRALQRNIAIFQMMKGIRELAGSTAPTNYVRGLIISMTESLGDMILAETFVKKAFGSENALPIIPLFEKVADLKNGCRIVNEWLRLHQFKKFEVMLGYSDSSKADGVLPSRLQIRETMLEIEHMSKQFPKLTITYFHGSGGSIDRGGGRLEDQCAHWPKAALDRYKVTIQGEMIQRSFSTPEILRQYLDKIHEIQHTIKKTQSFQEAPELRLFSDKISQFYRSSINDTSFLTMVEKASAYRFLKLLHFGSRPSKRKKLESINSLRAIPWILGWTQTRILLPTWWGFGSAFEQMTLKEKKKLAQLGRGADPLFASFMHQLGFTIAKIDCAIWFMYLDKSDLPHKEKVKFHLLFKTELEKTEKAFYFITGKKNFMWLRPWLLESIRLRSPLIHPLNIAQLIAWQKKKPEILRDATVGIACGMLTTG